MEDLQFISNSFLLDYGRFLPDRKTTLPALQIKLQNVVEIYIKTLRKNQMTIDLDQASAILDQLNVILSPSEMKTIFSRVDEEVTGLLNLRQFLNFLLLAEGDITDPVPVHQDLKKPLVRGKSRMFRSLDTGTAAVKFKRRGFLELSIDLQLGDGYELEVAIKQCRDLMPKDGSGLPDPYVKLRIEPDPKNVTKQKTQVVKASRSPVYNETFRWKLNDDASFKEKRLSISVWEYDRFAKNEFMGGLSFLLTELLDYDAKKDGWFNLLDKKMGERFNFPARMRDIESPVRSVRRSLSSTVSPRFSLLDFSTAMLTVDSFTYLKILGRGNFGKVVLARHKERGNLCALKIVKKIEAVLHDDVNAVLTERQALEQTALCPFFPRLHGSFQTVSHLYFVMDVCCGGDLLSQIQKRGCLGEPEAQFVAAEVSIALFFLHSQGIIYRDLKPDNIMFNGEGHIKIVDFGMAKCEVGDGMAYTVCGTPSYIAPEIVGHRSYNYAVDWWSFGVMLHEMLTGKVIFNGEDQLQIFDAVMNKPIELSPKLSKNAHQLISKLVVRAPKERLGYGPAGRKALREEPFFKGVDWDLFSRRDVPSPIEVATKSPEDLLGAVGGANQGVVGESPVDQALLPSVDQDQFHGFSFVAMHLLGAGDKR